MTATDALAAALRERLVDGRPALLPGLGALVRQHVSARVEEHPDGSRTLLPPGETIALVEGGEGEPIAEAFGRHRGLEPDEADAALARVMDEVEARLAATGEVRLHGVGLLRRTSGGVVLGVEAGLLEAVNQAYEGLAPLPAPQGGANRRGPAGGTPDVEPAPPSDEAAGGEAEAPSETGAAGADETAPPQVDPEAATGAEPEAPSDTAPAEPAPDALGDDPEDASAFPTLRFDDLLPHPAPDDEPDNDLPDGGSIAPGAPPDLWDGEPAPDGQTDDGPDAAEVEEAVPDDDIEWLAVPFGAPEGETLSDVFPPTPPEADPGLAPDDEGGAATDDAAAPAEPGGAADAGPDPLPGDGPDDEDAAPTEAPPPDDSWTSSTWASPPPVTTAPALGDPSAPAFEDAEVLDNESGDAEAPAEDVPDERTAAPGVAPSEAEAAPPAPPRHRGVPVDRVGPPVEAAAPPPVEALRSETPVPPDDLASQAERERAAAAREESGRFPWWAVGLVVLLLVLGLTWWLASRRGAEPGAPLATTETVSPAEPGVRAADPDDPLAAPATVEDALGVPPETAAPPPADGPAGPDAGAQPPRTPGGAAPAAAPTPGRSGGAANLVPPTLAGLGADDRAALSGGALDVGDRDTWTFVVASLRDPGDAAEVRQRYREAGFKTAVLSSGGLHRVAVGQFRSRSQALRLRDRLPPEAPPDTWALSLNEL